ncbi:peptide-N4-(N-acetyl-beta-glucosaminyl)asparagine amidase A [Malania oleifera]|uniref:peptide-N4-(N-acetyl-beta- glucosaminyl)asparagine amidase A n=1 Tax=Malania oleifera TaxID=397392 RepID=UPI0025ADCD19|nr:peptide-N4-(N-acetyl-beta-glucosaminyl)asparagine amidase A [Malania oleifera]
MMLENVVNDVFTGVYRVKLSLLYYDDGIRVPLTLAQPKMNRKLGILDDESVLESERSANNSQKNGALSFDAPADLVIPIADDGDKGFWFRIQSDSDIHSKKIRIPPNTRRAVLELCLSFHGDDEFWYSNPPDAYIILNNLSTRRGHGAFREVYVAIDGNFVASEIPFPVIFTGGINPLFWEPAVAIGAFNLPSYDVELTPFLGLLLDGKHHDFQLGVSEAVSFWLLGANLHLWLDPHLMKVEAKSVVYQAPTLSVERQSEFKMLDGSFEIEGERKTRVAGWVNSGDGNLTTHMSRRIKFKSSISFQKNGTSKLVKQKIKVKTDVRVLSHTGGLISRSSVKRKYPLNIITSTLPGKDKDTYLIMTNVSHALKEKLRTRGDQLSSVSNSQVSGGWMVVKDHSVSSGAADTQQALSHRKGRSCYSRTIAAANGKVLTDQSSDACEASW